MQDPNDQHDESRRSFLLSGSGLLGSAWIAANWAGIAQAAHHAAESLAGPAPVGFQFFTPAEAADVEAVGAQIVPSGKTPGAREAHAVYFIDRTFATYFSAMGFAYRKGLLDFQDKFRAAQPGAGGFAAATSAAQIEFLKSIDSTAFFDTTRTLTILGMFTSPKYGGNYQGIGWKMMGFADQHAFTPPFGYYDAEYKGFVPYPETHA